MKFTTRVTLRAFFIAVIGVGLAVNGAAIAKPTKKKASGFERIATFNVFENEDIETTTVAEIVVATKDGKTLVYTDSEQEKIGFVDIEDPNNPKPAGTVEVDGEPTSVAVTGRYALAAVVVDDDFKDPKGNITVIDLKTRQRVGDPIPFDGQPDSIDVSPNERFAAVAVENERNEDLCVGGDFDGTEADEDDCVEGGGVPGGLPQFPAGYLLIVDLKGPVDNWTTRRVELTGIADFFGEDPEPEYVDINKSNLAAVTLQENNHVVLVHLPSGRIRDDFSTGTVDLEQIDIEDDGLITFTETLWEVPREPDGITWISNHEVATADEGDFVGGSRGFTIFDTRSGDVVLTSGNSNDHEAGRLGHYPDGRSDNKGNEPENVAYGKFGKEEYLFVGSERASVVFVYKVKGQGRRKQLTLQQVLPTGVGPEGLATIPDRGLFVAASENDERDEKFRATLTIYRLDKEATYPTIVSEDRDDFTPIPWAALSGLAVDPADDEMLYSVYDSFFMRSRIFAMDVSNRPAVITAEIELYDVGVLAAVDEDFSADLVNLDGSVNLDPEGISVSPSGGFWVASEGAGTTPNQTSPNLLLKVSEDGEIEQAVRLPAALEARQLRFGFEGVAAVVEEVGDEEEIEGLESIYEEVVYVAFQRPWNQVEPKDPSTDPDGRIRIGRYAVESGEWTFAYYPRDSVDSPQDGWVGLSDLAPLGDGYFAVVERDNQAGADARVKRIYKFSLEDVEFMSDDQTPNFDIIEKKLVRDHILENDYTAGGGVVLEKIEGLAVNSQGTAYTVTDNDGVDDSSGETQLLEFEGLF